MKKRTVVWIALACAILAGGAAAALLLPVGKRPFRNLEAADIAAATVCLSPPDKTLEVTDREALADYLRAAVIYRRDDSYTEYCGQGVTFDLTMADGAEVSVTAYNPFLVIDGVGYRTEYAPCEALNGYANDLLRHRAPVVLEQPPGLAVISDRTSVGALPGAYSWTHVGGDGRAVSTVADSAHPLDCRDLLAALDTCEADAVLEFTEEPTEILSVRCWSDREWGNSAAAAEEVERRGNAIALKPGGWVYEVRAGWETERGDGGTASYIFYVMRLDA